MPAGASTRTGPLDIETKGEDNERRRAVPRERPAPHTVKIRKMLGDTIDHVRGDVSKIEDPRGQALFETTAEVLIGLTKAYEDYENRSEEAWRS
jgi:hypothetical protein